MQYLVVSHIGLNSESAIDIIVDKLINCFSKGLIFLISAPTFDSGLTFKIFVKFEIIILIY